MTRKHLLATTLTCLLAAAVLGAAAGKPAIPPEDEKAIRAVVQLYFDGIIRYDEQALRKAFHADANVIGTTKEGEAEWEPFQEWVVYTRGEAPDPTGRDNHIVSIEVTGRAAIVKTDLNWPHVHYVDYLSLLKIDGQWKIVNKIWNRGEPIK